MLTALIATACVAGSILAVIGVWLGTRWLAGGDPEQTTRDLAGSVLFRVSALHGLILALVFAQEMIEYQQLRAETVAEAHDLSDIYFDSDRYGDAAAGAAIRGAVHGYLATARGTEWAHLGRTGRLSGEGWGEWDRIYRAILDLEPATLRQRDLRANMLARIHDVSGTRNRRETHAVIAVSAMFWVAAAGGVLLVAATYYPYAPTRSHLLLMSVFAGFTGLVLFVIFAFANPYREPGMVAPAAFDRVLDQIEASGLPETAPPG